MAHYSPRKNIQSQPSVCEDALNAISLGEECNESFVHYSDLTSNSKGTNLYPELPTNSSNSVFYAESPTKHHGIYPVLPNSLHTEPMSNSWVQIKNDDTPKPESFTVVSRLSSNKDKTNTASQQINNSKHEAEKHLITRVNSASKISLPRVKLSKVFRTSSQPQQFLVKTGGGMGVHVPELSIDSQYFGESNSTLTKTEDDEFYEIDLPETNVSDVTQSQNSKELDSNRKLKKQLPSQTLAGTASLAIKSIFMSSNDKDTKNIKTPEPEESVKNKMLDLWNNVRYSGWTINAKTNFSKEKPINMLGKVYHFSFADFPSLKCSDIEGFKTDFHSLIWLTYRRKFPTLIDSTLTSDCGWGCMIRCGQMMMAQALTRHILPLGWVWQQQEPPKHSSSRNHHRILSWFRDIPSRNAPFSIHNLVEAGQSMNKQAGNWYGPTSVVHMFKETLNKASKTFMNLNNICIYIAQDGGVYIQDILDLCDTKKCYCTKESQEDPDLDDWEMPSFNGDCHQNREAWAASECSSGKHKKSLNNNRSHENLLFDGFLKPNLKHNHEKSLNGLRSSVSSDEKSIGEWDLLSFPIKNSDLSTKSGACQCNGWKSVILFIPVRMGGLELNPIYYNCIYSILLDEASIGIIGGKPKHALYFVGFQDDELIHLDPHISQDSVDLETMEDVESYHCMSPRKLPISKMDPSATFGFYCKTREDFYKLIERIPKLATAKDGNLDSPIFEFLDGSSSNIGGARPAYSLSRRPTPVESPNDTDEFVID